MKSNIEFFYEQLRKETDGGSESMTHDDAIEVIRVWRDAYYAQKYPQPKPEPVKDIGYEQDERVFARIAAMKKPQPKQEPVEKRPQNCGTGFCSCIECPYPDHFPDAGKMIEPFGFFRSTPDGWEDCAETDEGARPLYEAPRPQHEQDNDLLTIAYMAGFDAGKKTAPQPDHFADAGKPMEREWVGLTDEQSEALADARNEAMTWAAKGRIPECGAFAGIAQNLDWLCDQFAIEAKLREKNT